MGRRHRPCFMTTKVTLGLVTPGSQIHKQKGIPQRPMGPRTSLYPVHTYQIEKSESTLSWLGVNLTEILQHTNMGTTKFLKIPT